MALAKSRGTLASPTSVNAEDFLGQIGFLGHDGSSYQRGAGIFALVDSTPGPGVMPTRLSFYTRNQANGFAKRLQLDRNGNFDIDPWQYNAGGLTPGLVFGEPASGEGISSKRTFGGNQYGLDFYTSYLYGTNLPRMSITNYGDVGIGTTTPTHRLHVYSNSGETVLGIQNIAGHLWQLYSTGPGNSQGAGHFMLRDSNTSAVRMFVSGLNGNVGIGITSPVAPLHVHDPVNSFNGSRFALTQEASGSTSLDGLALIYGSTDGYLVNYENGSLRFGTNSTERMRVEASGNVGIGTTSPNERLTVAGSMEVGTNAGDYRHVRIGGGNSSGFVYGSYPRYGDGIHLGYNYYADASGTNQVIAGDGATSRLSLSYGSIGMFVGGVGTEPTTLGVYINGLGNVGIGTASPSQKLHVAGTICATSFISCSDVRYKKEIFPLSSSLKNVLALQGVSYHWKSKEYSDKNFSNATQIGLIAQAVEKIYPEVVFTDDNGYKSIDYGHLTPVLIEAIKELHAKVEEMQKLREENQSLSTRLAVLEAAVKTLTTGTQKTENKSLGQLK